MYHFKYTINNLLQYWAVPFYNPHPTKNKYSEAPTSNRYYTKSSSKIKFYGFYLCLKFENHYIKHKYFMMDCTLIATDIETEAIVSRGNVTFQWKKQIIIIIYSVYVMVM